MKYVDDSVSSHEYEVKRMHLNGATFNAVVFYLRAGEPVNIDLEAVLRKTSLWQPPTEAKPETEHYVVFEVAPQEPNGITDLYVSRLTATLKEDDGASCTITLDDAREISNYPGLRPVNRSVIPIPQAWNEWLEAEVGVGTLPSERSLEDIVIENFRTVPPEEWERVPHDLVERLDHYLYGVDR